MDEKRSLRKRSLRERTAELFALPGEGIAGLPRLELTGDRELYLSNYRGILSYGKDEIHVDGASWVLRISGRELEIKAMGARELRIVGWVHSLELL